MARRKQNIPLSEANTPGSRLKHLRTQARLTRSEIAQKYELPAATLKAWENDVIPLSEKGLARCVKIYRHEGILLSREWVMSGNGVPPKAAIDIGRYFTNDLQYPERVTLNVNEENNNYQKDDAAHMAEEGQFFKQSHPNAVILLIQDDDMAPVYQVGDMVGGKLSKADKLKEILKQDCIVLLKDGSILLRRVYESKRTNGYNLACINPAPSATDPVMFDVNIEGAAPVIWHRKPDIQ
ncbi:MAG: transcriptional regulator [Gammaproteobacteria bacterium]|nr:transcriptional regulator [Gammaproteobacteria bacterium]